jgi:hypothetical protein
MDSILKQLQKTIRREVKELRQISAPALIMLNLPTDPTPEHIERLYLKVQKGMKAEKEYGVPCQQFTTAQTFRNARPLFEALLNYRDEPEVRDAYDAELDKVTLQAGKGVVMAEDAKSWPKMSRIVEAMEKAKSRMVEEAKVSKEAVEKAREIRKLKVSALEALNTDMDATDALQKVSEYQAGLQELLSGAGGLVHLLRAPSLPEPRKFSFKGGAQDNRTKKERTIADVGVSIS